MGKLEPVAAYQEIEAIGNDSGYPNEFRARVFAALARLDEYQPLSTAEPKLQVKAVRNLIDRIVDPASPLGALAIVKLAMKRQGLNSAGLADKMHCDRTTVYRIVDGTTKHPRVAILNAFIKALDLLPEQAEVLREHFSIQNNSAVF
jgi:hypothetical protein